MKIWFVTSIKRSSSGGVNRSINSLAEGLKKAGHSVKMLYAESAREKITLYFAFKAHLSSALFLQSSRQNYRKVNRWCLLRIVPEYSLRNK